MKQKVSFVCHWTKGLQRKAEFFCIRYFWRTKCKSTETITERCFSCQNKSVCQKLARSCKKWKSAKIRYTPFLHEGLQLKLISWVCNSSAWSLPYAGQITAIKFAGNSVAINLYARRGGFPITLLKTVSCISNWPFHASQKIWKTAICQQKKASNHISHENAKAKSCFTLKYKFYSHFAKHTNIIITKMYLFPFYLTLLKCAMRKRHSSTWPSFVNFRLCSCRSACLDLLWLG